MGRPELPPLGLEGSQVSLIYIDYAFGFVLEPPELGEPTARIRIGRRADELVRFDGNRAYMRMVDGHCAALHVEKSSGQLVCSAYETRPQTCRDLARASGACLGEIASKHDRPLLALVSRPAVRPPFRA